MDIRIRKATESDFEKVYPLFEQLWSTIPIVLEN
jgi:hypothetical protein